MTRYVVKLTFKSPVHFGSKEKFYEIAQPTASSNTLFGGLCNAWRLLYGKSSLEELLSLFEAGDTPFLISSTFPFYRDTLFLPRPSVLNLSENIGDYKKAKKVKYVPIDVLFGRQKVREYPIIKEGFLFKEEVEYVYKGREIPRVILDDVTHSSLLYHVQAYSFAKEAGLYFFLDVCEEGYLPKIIGALHLLSEEGLGGERTYGYGMFEFNIIEFKLETPTRGDYLLLSSLYVKPNDLAKLNPISYEITHRGGYIYSMGGQPYRRKSMLMIGEGSLFKNKPKGALVDVTPEGFREHQVFSNGLAYSLQVAL